MYSGVLFLCFAFLLWPFGGNPDLAAFDWSGIRVPGGSSAWLIAYHLPRFSFEVSGVLSRTRVPSWSSVEVCKFYLHTRSAIRARCTLLVLLAVCAAFLKRETGCAGHF